MKERLLVFWDRNPAFFYGLILFLGCLFATHVAWVLLPFVVLLHKKRLLQMTLVFLLPCCMVYQLYTLPAAGETVEGKFFIHTLHTTNRFKNGWSYYGILKTDKGRLHCRCFSKSYYPPTSSYKIQGLIRAHKGHVYTLNIQEPWRGVGRRFTLTAWRNSAQGFVKKYIEKHFVHERSAHFLTGMVMGGLEDRLMKKEFSALGLSHLMAISGLHFSLLALVCHLLLRLLLPPKAEAVFLMMLLTLYLLFIGNTPSILRAWITVMVFLSGQLLEKRSPSLNSLGTALVICLLLDPLSAASLSLQLSFLATGGILCFYSPCDRVLMLWLPKRDLKEIIGQHWLWQHSYIVMALFREALALTLAVHIALLPLLVHTFHAFCASSLFYNLFFPFLASLALIFFLISIPLGHWAHVLNSYYCDTLLCITESPPLLFKSFYLEEMPAWLLTLILTSLLLGAILCTVEKRADGLRVTDGPLFDHLSGHQ